MQWQRRDGLAAAPMYLHGKRSVHFAESGHAYILRIKKRRQNCHVPVYFCSGGTFLCMCGISLHCGGICHDRNRHVRVLVLVAASLFHGHDIVRPGCGAEDDQHTNHRARDGTTLAAFFACCCGGRCVENSRCRGSTFTRHAIGCPTARPAIIYGLGNQLVMPVARRFASTGAGILRFDAIHIQPDIVLVVHRRCCCCRCRCRGGRHCSCDYDYRLQRGCGGTSVAAAADPVARDGDGPHALATGAAVPKIGVLIALRKLAAHGILCGRIGGGEAVLVLDRGATLRARARDPPPPGHPRRSEAPQSRRNPGSTRLQKEKKEGAKVCLFVCCVWSKVDAQKKR